jgi:hypothetical protein
LRSQPQDLTDAKAFVKLGKVVPAKLLEYFEGIRRDVIRYPRVDAADLESRLKAFASDLEAAG